MVAAVGCNWLQLATVGCMVRGMLLTEMVEGWMYAKWHLMYAKYN